MRFKRLVVQITADGQNAWVVQQGANGKVHGDNFFDAYDLPCDLLEAKRRIQQELNGKVGEIVWDVIDA